MASGLCVSCGEEVRVRQEHLRCVICNRRQHRTCDSVIMIMTQKRYRELMHSTERFSWRCKNCASSYIPDVAEQDSGAKDAMADLQDDDSLSTTHVDIPTQGQGPRDGLPIKAVAEPADTTPQFVVLPIGRGGNDRLYDSQGYSYNILRRNKNGSIKWQCSKRTKEQPCKANVVQRCDTFVCGEHQHMHEGVAGALNEAMMIAECIAKCGDNPLRSGATIAEEVQRDGAEQYSGVEDTTADLPDDDEVLITHVDIPTHKRAPGNDLPTNTMAEPTDTPPITHVDIPTQGRSLHDDLPTNDVDKPADMPPTTHVDIPTHEQATGNDLPTNTMAEPTDTPPTTHVEIPTQGRSPRDNLPINAVVEPADTPTQFVVLPLGRSGKDRLYDSRGYSYNILRRNKNGSIKWQCCNRSKPQPCNASVMQSGDTFLRGEKRHTHEGAAGALTKAKMVAECIAQARDNPLQSGATIAEKVQRDSQYKGADPISTTTLARRINRRRGAARS